MDKESVILKHLQNEMDQTEEDLACLSKANDQNNLKLDDLKDKTDEIYKLLKIKKKENKATGRKEQSIKPLKELVEPASLTYEELYQEAELSLRLRGLDPKNLDSTSLVTDKELELIEKELNRPLSRKERWIKSDYIAVFIAASIGSLADLVLGDRKNKFTGRDSDFSNWLNKFHKHDSGGPIDYQEKGLGGPYHRGLSKGHDILRFVEGIMMFKNGQFQGVKYVDGVAEKVISSLTPSGNPYDQLTLIEAILKYAQHMFGDLFSTCSLPFPGSSFLVESSNRDLRKLAATMYQNGFNIKNIMIQSVSTIIVEVILRIYFAIKSVQEQKEKYELLEDYSNLDRIKEFIKPSSKEKLHEMLLLSHSIVLGINLGKVVIKKSPWEINVTEIIAVIKYSFNVVGANVKRNSEYEKLIRNSQELHIAWQEFEGQIVIE